MIRRISKNNDYRDIIRSCPTGVIDDIHTIKYFISGHPETEIEATFEKKGNVLEVILPSSQLQTLGNGVLMRRALYSEVDPVFPDGEYNLEFVDDLNVWLGDEETLPPFDPGYLTEEDLKTINDSSLVGVGNLSLVTTLELIQQLASTESYVITSLQSWVSYNFIDNTELVSALSSYATQSYVSNNFVTYNYLSSNSYVTQSWVSQNFLSSTALTGYATQSWVQSQGYLTSHQDLSSYATQSWVQSQGYITSETIPSDIATQSWVSQNFLSSATLTGYATQSWVESQGYLTSHQDLSSYATKSWVSSQSYLTSASLTGYATQSWVESQGYLTSHQDLSSYATQSWVESQGYLTSHQDLSSYATQSWVSSNFFEESKVWTGTMEEWVLLTPSEQASYTIALIIE